MFLRKEAYVEKTIYDFPFDTTDVICFKDGKKIRVRESWEEGDQIKCRRFGGIVSYPKSKIEHIEKETIIMTEEKKAVKDSALPADKTADNNSERVSEQTAEIGDDMCKAASDGDMEKLRQYVLDGHHPDTRSSAGTTPLMNAGYKGRLEVIRYLIRQGADVNTLSKSKIGSSVLIWAVGGGNIQAVRFIVNAGAKIDVRGKSGLSPLCKAISNEDIPVTRFLLQSGADVNYPGLMYSDIGGKKRRILTPLIAAALRNQEAILEMLIEKDAEINSADKFGYTALMFASSIAPDSLKSVKKLVENGADVNHRGPRGHTALIYASYNNKKNVVKYLLDKGADWKLIATDEAVCSRLDTQHIP